MGMTTHLTDTALQAIFDVEAHNYESNTSQNKNKQNLL